MMPWEKPNAICMGIMYSFWLMPMAAMAAAPKGAVKLFRMVEPSTLSRFWMAAGMPTPRMLRTCLPLSLRSWKGFMHT